MIREVSVEAMTGVTEATTKKKDRKKKKKGATEEDKVEDGEAAVEVGNIEKIEVCCFRKNVFEQGIKGRKNYQKCVISENT